jgi:hypothetical protein
MEVDLHTARAHMLVVKAADESGAPRVTPLKCELVELHNWCGGVESKFSLPHPAPNQWHGRNISSVGRQ